MDNEKLSVIRLDTCYPTLYSPQSCEVSTTVITFTDEVQGIEITHTHTDSGPSEISGILVMPVY